MIADRKKRNYDKILKIEIDEEERRLDEENEDRRPRHREEVLSERSAYLPGSRPEVDTGMRPEHLRSSSSSPTASRVTWPHSGGTASTGGGGRGLQKSSLVSTLISTINTFHADKPRLPRITAEQQSTTFCKDDGFTGGGTALRTAREEQDFAANLQGGL